jgi:hypothetical protein
MVYVKFELFVELHSFDNALTGIAREGDVKNPFH